MESWLQLERNKRGPFGMGPWQASERPADGATARRDVSWMNLTAFCLALGSLLLPYVSIVGHIAAVVLGSLGSRAARRGEASSRWAGIAGIVIAVIGMALYIPATLFLLRA